MEPAPAKNNGGISAAESSTEGSNCGGSSNTSGRSGGSKRSRLRRSGGGAIPPATANLPGITQQSKPTMSVQPSRPSLEGEEEETKIALAVVSDGSKANNTINRPESTSAVATNNSQTVNCESEDMHINSMKRSVEAVEPRRRRRRQWWWWRQQQRRRRRRSQSQNERKECQQRNSGEIMNINKTPSGPYRSALYLNPSIRCVGSDGLPYRQSFKELLRSRAAEEAEADTPCLGPVAAPLCVQKCSHSILPTTAENEEETETGNNNEEEEEKVTANSPMITFTLDGVATPKTFAVIKRQEVYVDSTPLPAASLLAEERKVQISPIRPPRAVRMKELPHQQILRGYVNGSFLFYQTEESKQGFLKLCREILAQARPIFESESLFPRLVAPTFVFGDIHGNFEDLAFFLRNVLIFHDLQLTPANLLCLGDYVDRGPYSLECLMLLLSLKISHPSKVVLLRGNHEDRVVCGDLLTYGSASFLAQCESLYGNIDGRQLFKEATALFRHFPLAAELLIPSVPNSNGGGNINIHNNINNDDSGNNNNNNNNNSMNPSNEGLVSPMSRLLMPLGRRKTHEERILCTHGGIPRFFCPPKEDDSLAFLRSDDFPRMLTLFPNNPFVRGDPEAQAELLETAGKSNTHVISEATLRKAWYVAFDLMWSDPTSIDPGDEEEDDESITNIAARGGRAVLNEWGFGVNKRGSNVLTFSAKAVDTFLQAHQYSMLFRAHQEKAHGLRVSKSSKVLTIFSSSNYLGHGNGAGCAVVTADGEIQLVEKLSE